MALTTAAGFVAARTEEPGVAEVRDTPVGGTDVAGAAPVMGAADRETETIATTAAEIDLKFMKLALI